MREGPALTGDVFAKFRKSVLFAESRKHYEPGWTTQDRIADPKFIRLSAAEGSADLRLQSDSPAVDGGQDLPRDWPDPLRDADKAAPDIGALHSGAAPWGVGMDGRLSLFGGLNTSK